MLGFDWMVFMILVAMGMVGALAIMPYALETAGDKIPAEQGARRTLIIAGFVQNSILTALAAGIGLAAAGAVGLGTPVLGSVLNDASAVALLVQILPVAVGVGGLTALALGLLDRFVFAPSLPASVRNLNANMPVWKRLAASLYGGVNEEILMRLFLVSGLTWLLGRFWVGAMGMPASGAYWTAIILTALLFGLGHLPATRSMAPLTPALVFRALLLNGIAGVAFGWLYWQFGLEAAMVAHFSADLVIHVAGPFLGQSTEKLEPGVASNV